MSASSANGSENGSASDSALDSVHDMADGPSVLVSVEDGVGRLVLNRPARRNALSAEMVRELARMLSRWANDDAVRAVLITGAGRGFCAGGDVKAFAERGGEAGGSSLSPAARVEQQRANQRGIVGVLHAMPQPTVAALPGAAAGAGLGLALACDLRVAARDALLVPAFSKVALSGDYGVTWLLTRLAGPAVARRMLLMEERVTAADAVALGLVDVVTDADDVDTTATEIATRLAAGPRQALRGLKANLLDAERFDLLTAMDREVPRHQRCGASDDHREAVTAFVEHRDPRFGQHPAHQEG